MFKEFDRVIGYASVKEELKRICDIVKNYEKYKKLGVKFPGGLLLEGEPGVGKTTMAECFIKATGLKSFVCRKNKSDGEFVDEIKRVFDEAKKVSPAIVFLDDMDKFANEDNHHKDAEEYVTVQSCIDELKGKEVFVIATINDTYKLPDSLKRAGRFDKIIYIQNPTGEDARNIVEHYLSRLSNVEGIRADEVATLLDGSSCAELETVINKAGMYAGYSGKEKIDMDDILQAFLDINYDVDKEEMENTKEAQCIAVHEAGHMVMAELLFPGSVNLVVYGDSCDDFGQRGFVSKVTDNFDMDPFKRRENEIMVSLAGKAATEVMLKTIDMGCEEDMRKAFFLVDTFVYHYCAYGFDTFIRKDSGDEVANRKDYLVAKKVENYYKDTLRMIDNNKEFLQMVSKELLEKRILLRKDIDRIKKSVRVNVCN